MKILFFSENTHRGGVDTFLGDLILAWPNPEDELIVLGNRSHPGLVFLRERLGGKATVASHGIPLYVDFVLATASRASTIFFRKICSPLLRPAYFLIGYFRFRMLFARGGADRLVVVAGGYPGGDSCLCAVFAWPSKMADRTPAFFNLHNLVVQHRNFLAEIVDRAIAKRLSWMIAVSLACENSVRVRPALYAGLRLTHILNGIAAPNAAKAHGVKSELGLSEEDPLCLMLATYEPRKGHDFLLSAFRIVADTLPTARLLVCGFGRVEEIERVRRRVNAEGLAGNVILCAFRADKDRLLAAADVVVIASQSQESFGLVGAEAMAMGKPVVATRIAGISEVVQDGEGGFCVEPNDVAGFAEKLLLLLRNPTLRVAQGERGRQRYQKHFTAERMAREYADLIRA